MVKEDADQHLHHFTIELKGEVMRQDQLGDKDKLLAEVKTLLEEDLQVLVVSGP